MYVCSDYSEPGELRQQRDDFWAFAKGGTVHCNTAILAF